MPERKVQMPTPEEDAAINCAIAADPDTFKWNEFQIKQLKLLAVKGHAGRFCNDNVVTPVL